MFQSFSVRKKSGLILAGILAVTGITAAYQPPKALGTNDCDTEWAAVESAYSSLGTIDSGIVTLSGSIYPLASSMNDIMDDTSDMIDTLITTVSGSTLTGGTLTSIASMASSAFSTANVNFATVDTMSGDLVSLISSQGALVDSIDESGLYDALEDFEACMAD